ncbi:MAG: metal dependent phosphohydrolase [Clostridiaceae bacterium]|jgi:putative nucleotidyltransferase with HDIG domain|nr:metal dependent phosphohydrolase [Clostridiaceae bacterium]
MKIYRFKQFYWAITAKVNKNDKNFIEENLNEIEKDLFFRLSKSDQKHSLRVAYKVKVLCKESNISDKILVKAALLHDIGKVECSLGVIDKSILVIADKILKGNLKKFKNIKKVNTYYNHAESGYEILKKYDYDKKFLNLIRNHHMTQNDCNAIDRELSILIKSDNEN